VARKTLLAKIMDLEASFPDNKVLHPGDRVQWGNTSDGIFLGEDWATASERMRPIVGFQHHDFMGWPPSALERKEIKDFVSACIENIKSCNFAEYGELAKL